MNISVEEFKELYELIKREKYTDKIDSYLGQNSNLTRNKIKEIRNELNKYEYGYPKKLANDDPLCLADSLEKNLKEAIEKFDSWMNMCEHMLAMIKTIKRDTDEIAECDGKIAACVTAVKEIGESLKDPVIEEFENKLGNAIKNYENRMY